LVFINEFKVDSGIVTSIAGDKLLGDLVSIYPNPNTGSFKLKVPSLVTENGNLAITNALGQQVWSTKIIASEEQDVSLGHLPTGIYQINLEIGTRQIRKSFIIER
jgi:hypothetical protein